MSLLAWPARTTVAFSGRPQPPGRLRSTSVRGMDAGPGTDLGGLGWFLGVWAAMMAAMMLPSAVLGAVAAARASRGLPTTIFGVGYLAVWTAFGVLAYALFRAATSLDLGRLAWDQDGPYTAGALIVLAGIYELTPLKQNLLRRCRSPHDRGERGALGTGVVNGVYCVGCCLGLMAVLFALGVMSPFWMVLIAAAIFVEKVFRHGPRLTRVVGIGLIVLGAMGRSLAFDRSDAGRAWAVNLHGNGDAVTDRTRAALSRKNLIIRRREGSRAYRWSPACASRPLGKRSGLERTKPQRRR